MFFHTFSGLLVFRSEWIDNAHNFCQKLESDSDHEQSDSENCDGEEEDQTNGCSRTYGPGRKVKNHTMVANVDSINGFDEMNLKQLGAFLNLASMKS